MELKDVTPRTYQERIFASAAKQNTLVILPTGTGKTMIAILLALHRLKTIKGSKILVMAPTKPLCAQHRTTFIKHVSGLPKDDFCLITGETSPKKRAEEWEASTIIFATPQTIINDLENKTISLEDVSLIVFDEAHRTVGDYAYVPIGKTYQKQAKNQRVLALTASPSSERIKIENICNYLNIQKIESLSYDDAEVTEHMPVREIETVEIDLPQEMLDVQELFKKTADNIVEILKAEKWIYTKNVSKNMIIMLQKRISMLLKKNKNGKYFRGLLLAAAAVKAFYFLELFESYGVDATLDYYKKTMDSETKSAKMVKENENFKKAIEMCNVLNEKGFEHPKLKKLKEMLEVAAQDAGFKAIVFTNFRSSAHMLFDNLVKSERLKPVVFIGKAGAGGLKQNEQMDVINSFREGERNVLIATSIGEEGIDIPSATLGVFFDSVPSAIRKIQREGRVGRTSFGKVLLLIGKKTIDERYHKLSTYKENKMKKIIKSMQTDGIKMQKTLETYGD